MINNGVDLLGVGKFSTENGLQVHDGVWFVNWFQVGSARLSGGRQ